MTAVKISDGYTGRINKRGKFRRDRSGMLGLFQEEQKIGLFQPPSQEDKNLPSSVVSSEISLEFPPAAQGSLYDVF